jgi:alanine racemase
MPTPIPKTRITSPVGAVVNSGPVLTVDLLRIKANYRYLHAMLAPTTSVAGVVKADAYGLGMEAVGKALHQAGCREFFVAWPEEGVDLRPHLPDCPIYVLHGAMPGSAADLHAHNLIPVCNHLGQVAEWANYARSIGKKLPVVLHVDSGLNRLGMPFQEVEKLAAQPDLLNGLELRLIMSHLAIPALANHPMNQSQLADFKSALALLPKTRASLAASSGSFLGGEYRFDLARIGSSIYGMNPLPNKPNPMQAVTKLEFPILQLQEVPVGKTIGYGCTFKTERVTRVATLGGGFSDGYMRSLSNSGTIWLGDYRAPVIGRVSMDLITIDVTDIPAHLVQPGEMVAILHDLYTVNHLAGEAKTRTTEILCGLGRKPKRQYVG